MKGLILVLFFILSCPELYAQNTPPAWTGYFRGTGDNSDKFNKVISDGGGNFIAVGYTVRTGNYRDILTVKFDAAGDTLWWRTKNGKGNGDDEGISVGVDASGFVYVAGNVDGGRSQTDIMVIKYDASGAVQWDTTWDSPSSLDDVVVGLQIDGAGNCIVGGNAEPDTVAGSSDYAVLKYAPNGALLWSQQFSRSGVASGKDELTALGVDSNDDIYVTGRSFNASNDDFMTIKYDGSNGNPLWMQGYNGGFEDRATALVIDHGGNVIITGRSGNGSDFDYRTIKYDNAGLLQWTRLYNAPASEDDRPNAIAVDASDNVIVTGISDIDGSPSSNYDFQTLKYDASGTLQWVVRTGNVVSQDDETSDLVVDASGNIFVTGKTDMNPLPGMADYDFMTVMYNSSGMLQWSGAPLYHNGTRLLADDIAHSLVLDGSGNLYVAGVTTNNVTQKDATVVKYDIAGGTVVWVKNFNGTGDFSESARALVVDANNLSYAAGYSFQEGQNLNACIAKFDQAGNNVCTYMYNGLKNDDDEFEAIAISASGSIYAAGYTKVTGQKSDMLLVKFDPASCDTLWTRTYDFIKQVDKAQSMVLDAVGNIYVTGRSDSNPVDTTDNNDFVTIKYDSNGNVLWTQRYDGLASLRDEPEKIILDVNGDVLVGGRTENIHDDDFIVIKYNASTGNPVWGSPIIYNGPFSNDDRVNDIKTDGAGNIFISGYSQTASGVSTNDPVLLKYDPSGNQLGFYSYIGDGKDEPVKMAIDINGNVYTAIKFDTQPGILTNSYNILVKKFDNQLNDLWMTSSPQYNSPVNGDDVPADIKINSFGEIYVTGTTENDTSGGRVNKNWITLGYNDQGNQIFISNFDGPNATDDSPNAIVLRGNVMWVCGNTEGTLNEQKDLTVNNYNLPSGATGLPAAGRVLVYPNPFSTECTIRVPDEGKGSRGSLEVFDLLGKSVAQPQAFIGGSAIFRKGNLAPGLYQYRITFDDQSSLQGKFIIN